MPLTENELRDLLHHRDQLLVGEANRHAHDLGALADALDVLAHLEQVELALLLVPVAADALEYRRPVVEGVGHDVHVRLLERDEMALKKRGRGRHWEVPCCAVRGLRGVARRLRSGPNHRIA